MGWIRKRLGESSTHIGLTTLSTVLGAYIEGGSGAAKAAAVAAVFSIFWPQSNGPKP